jgi:biopolymer transport protein TolQ
VLGGLIGRVDGGAANADELRGIAQQAITAEERRAARHNSVLQGVAATGPLLGLLGTVWGIIEAFLAMDQHASSAIGVVAPAMAGALLTTALGLVAAIPSILALQYAERRVNELVAELDGAAQTWIGVLQRENGAADEMRRRPVREVIDESDEAPQVVPTGRRSFSGEVIRPVA